MSIQSPVGTLDIKNATLRVGKLEVSNIQGVDTALNVTRANSVLIYDDQASTTTFTGTTSSAGVRDTVNGYLDVADGYVYWGQKLPNAWVMDFEMDIRSGTNAGSLNLNVFSSINTGSDGYSIVFDDNGDNIILKYDGATIATAAVSGLFTASENWQKVVINYERGTMIIGIGGERKLYFQDIERETPYTTGEYINFSSVSADGRKIRDLKITNGSKWIYAGESNVVYTQGSVGIGVTDPTTALDVSGTVKATALEGDGSAITNISSANVGDFASNVTRIETLETDLTSNVGRIGTLETDLGSNVTRIGTLETGNMTISGQKTFSGDVIFESNVHMQGDVFVANTVNMTVSDPIIELGSNNLNTGDLGIIMTRHGATNSNIAIVFDESADVLRMGYTLGGASDADITLDSNVLAVSVQGALTAASVSGDGSGLTSLNASNVSSGTLDNARLPSTINVTNLIGDGSGLTSLNASNVSSGTLDNARLPSTINVTNLIGDGSGLTSLNASNVSSGTLTRPISTTTGTFSGNVGIGTDSPGYKLDVHGTSNVSTLRATSLLLSNGASTTITEDYIGSNPYTYFTNSNDNDNSYMQFLHNFNNVVQAGSGPNSEIMSLQVKGKTNGTTDADTEVYIPGNLGIGTDSPLDKLMVMNGTIRSHDSGNTTNIPGLKIRRRPAVEGQSGSNYIECGQFNDVGNDGSGTDGNRFIVKNDGNVGIGTVSPRAALEVYGSIMGSTNSTTYSHNLYYDTQWKYAQAGYGGATMRMVDSEVQFWNAPNDNASANSAATITQRVTIAANGNVGIGTDNPTGEFHINGENMYFSSKLVSNCTWRIMPQTSNSTKLFRIYDQDNTADRLVINASGNVGIGTTSPGEALSIYRNDANPTYVHVVSNASNRAGISLSEDSNKSVIIEYDGTGTGAGNYLAFYSGVSTWAAKGAGLNYVPSNGHVGIGTSSPFRPLTIESSSFDGIRVKRTTAGGGSAMELINGNGDEWTVGVGGTGTFGIHDGATFGEQFTIDTNGRIGIGTTSPEGALDIVTSSTTPALWLRNSTQGGWARIRMSDSPVSSYNQYCTLEYNHQDTKSLGFQNRLHFSTTETTTGGVFSTEGSLMIGVDGKDGGQMGSGTGTGRKNLWIQTTYGGNTSQNHGWWIGTQNQTPTASDNDLYFAVVRDGTIRVPGYIQDSLSQIQMNFTGQHRTFVKDVPIQQLEDKEGLIVSADQNDFIRMSGGIVRGNEAITTNESLPIVSFSTKSNDKKCFGVVSTTEDPENRVEVYGNFASNIQKELGDTRVYINSVGEGAIWVTDISGPLESGDYITTSNVAGYGQRQDDDILHNYTVAKITMDCDFNPRTQPKKIIKKELAHVDYWIDYATLEIKQGEYETLPENEREIHEDKYYKIYKREIQKINPENDRYAHEVHEELVNVLDEHGQLQWEDDPSGATEKAYKIRYLDALGAQTDEANAVHIAAFVGCTYHCG